MSEDFGDTYLQLGENISPLKGCPTLSLACGYESAGVRVFVGAVAGLTFGWGQLGEGVHARVPPELKT